MEQAQTENSAAGGLSAGDRCVSRLAEVEEYLRDEADFNRSWTDGRRGADMNPTEQYTARRLEVARQRDEWADAIALAIKKMAANAELCGGPSGPSERAPG